MSAMEDQPSEGRPLRVMLVEDHALVRAAIRRTLDVPEIEVVAEASSAEQALATVMDYRPDIILLDIDLPGMNGVQLVRELAPRLPDSHIVMLTGSADRDDLVQAVRNGASGYLTKDTSPDGLVRAILGVRQGDLPMPRRLAAQLVRQLVGAPEPRTSHSGLSVREMEVLKLVTDGLTDRDIGSALGISPRTVGRHVGNVLDKLGVRNRAEAARRYREGV
jgi:two-component system, NarL family, response regulator DevR